MYNEDDAVAKVDGYVISVTRGGRHIGAQKLIRIDRVARSAASASLVDEDEPPEGEPAIAAAGSRGEGGGRRGRGRGRRGGRGETDPVPETPESA